MIFFFNSIIFYFLSQGMNLVPPLESSEKKYLNEICLKKLKIPLDTGEISEIRTFANQKTAVNRPF